MARVKPLYFPFQGGLNLVTPALSMEPGEIIYSKNIEPNMQGGYRSSAGYEAFDGKTRPVDTTKTIDGNLETTSSYHYLSDTDKATFDTARETNRSAIAAVPGEGDILGICVYNGTVYAVRNAVGGASSVMFKATSGGWSSVLTGLTADGTYEFDIYNFGAGAYLFFVNGVNKAYQYDGTTFTALTTGQPTDTPTHVKAYKEHLFLSFPGGTLVNSETGDPTAWTGGGGAIEYYVKDDIVALESLKDLMVIFMTNQTLVMYGAVGGSDQEMKSHSETAGAYARTVVTESTPIFFNHAGISMLTTTEAYGNFQTASVSRKVQPLLNQYKNPALIAGAALDIDNDLYRLYFTDGKVMNMLFNGQDGSDILFSDYGTNFTSVGQGYIDDEMRIFTGDDSGWVYQMEVGGSFNGANIEMVLKTSYATFNTPQQFKRFFKMVVEMESPSALEIHYTPDYSYGSSIHPGAVSQSDTIEPGGGAWNVEKWDEFFWTSPTVAEGEGDLDGEGKNISMTFYTLDKNIQPYTLQGITYQISIRGLAR